MTGIDRFSDKEKRKIRLHNHIARDLRTPKYKQRRVEIKKKKVVTDGEYEHWTSHDWLNHFEDEEDIVIDND